MGFDRDGLDDEHRPHSQIFTVQLKPVFSSPFGGGHFGGNPPLGGPKGSEFCLEQVALAVSGVGAVD